jgi:hypothetical protein
VRQVPPSNFRPLGIVRDGPGRHFSHPFVPGPFRVLVVVAAPAPSPPGAAAPCRTALPLIAKTWSLSKGIRSTFSILVREGL